MSSLSARQLGSLAPLHISSLIGNLQLDNVAYSVVATEVVVVMMVELVLIAVLPGIMPSNAQSDKRISASPSWDV
jgi:hypothetical protein